MCLDGDQYEQPTNRQGTLWYPVVFIIFIIDTSQGTLVNSTLTFNLNSSYSILSESHYEKMRIKRIK